MLRQGYFADRRWNQRKASEIGRKWIINQFINGFISVTAPANPVIADVDCAIISLMDCIKIFGEIPESFTTDRGMYSADNIMLCKTLGIGKIGIQPKGNAAWEVDPETARELYCRRASIEPRIGHAGRLGLKMSRMKTDDGDLISGQKSAIGLNLRKLLRCWAI